MQLHILLGPVAVRRSAGGARVLNIIIQVHPQEVEAVHLVDGLELYRKPLESKLRVVKVDVPRRVQRCLCCILSRHEEQPRV